MKIKPTLVPVWDFSTFHSGFGSFNLILTVYWTLAKNLFSEHPCKNQSFLLHMRFCGYLNPRITLKFQLPVKNLCSMARGVSSGGGQSSLGYLFGSPEPPQPKLETMLTPSHLINHTTTKDQQAVRKSLARRSSLSSDDNPDLVAPLPVKVAESNDATSLYMGPQQIRSDRNSNNYHRADGQNSGNFITVRST